MRKLVMLTTLAVGVLAAPGCKKLVERQIASNLGRVDTSVLSSPDLTVVLCGTGSPLPDPARASACTAVIAGGQFVVVDAGPGSAEVLNLTNLPIANVNAVLLTHFHSDHIGDLGEMGTQTWIAGRQHPLDVYGPPGVTQVVAGFNEAYGADVTGRVAHHGEVNLPRAAGQLVAHEVALPGDAGTVVFDQGGLRITMFPVDHHPVAPAVGYRFDYRGRTVVVSGDTKKSAVLPQQARGADILVHEALRSDMIALAVEVATRLGQQRLAQMAKDILDYHTTPVEAAEIAAQAGVPHLVLTHLVPAPNNFLQRRMFLNGVSDVYKGKVTLGADYDRFTLTPKS